MANNKKKTEKEQLNLRVDSKTVKELKDYAKKQNLKIVNGKSKGKPSISKLLENIGNGKFEIVKRKGLLPKLLNLEDKQYCLNFQMKVHNYSGVLAEVSKIFGDHKVEIIGLEATAPSHQKYAYFDIIGILPPASDPKILLKKIQELKFSNIKDYLSDLSQIKLENFLIIGKITCSISIQILATSRTGLLADISSTIANCNINIISAYRVTDNGRLSTSYFHLEWTTLEKSNHLLKELREIKSINRIDQVDVDKIIQRFNRIRFQEDEYK